MPYITEFARDTFYPVAETATSPGELNYQITQLCLLYLGDRSVSYQRYNDVIGALECCKLEMYRRAIAPYEDTKIAENGDVFP